MTFLTPDNLNFRVTKTDRVFLNVKEHCWALLGPALNDPIYLNLKFQFRSQPIIALEERRLSANLDFQSCF